MVFNRKQVADLLARCHRRCCICHRFCGVKMETDHILPIEQDGDDSIENAIPVCFECHAEIHSYNDKHPRGRKFTPDELRKHKKQWLTICRDHPEVLIAQARTADVGPLQALIDELAFNEKVARRTDPTTQGAKFHITEFQRAIQHGAIAILRDEISESVLDAYAAMEAANGIISAAWSQGIKSNLWHNGTTEVQKRISEAAPLISNASSRLMEFLGSEASDSCTAI